MPPKRQNPEEIANRARSNGYERGKHAERDKKAGVKNYSPHVLAGQDRVLHVYAV